MFAQIEELSETPLPESYRDLFFSRVIHRAQHLIMADGIKNAQDSGFICLDFQAPISPLQNEDVTWPFSAGFHRPFELNESACQIGMQPSLTDRTNNQVGRRKHRNEDPRQQLHPQRPVFTGFRNEGSNCCRTTNHSYEQHKRMKNLERSSPVHVVTDGSTYRKQKAVILVLHVHAEYQPFLGRGAGGRGGGCVLVTTPPVSTSRPFDGLGTVLAGMKLAAV